MADEGVDHGHHPTSESTFEGAPSASGVHASPSPTTTTLPTPYPAAATSTPIDAFPWGGLATGRCGEHAKAGRQAKHCAHRGIITLVSCDKAFQDPCHSETREQSMYSNTSGCVHMGLRLDWDKGITGQ